MHERQVGKFWSRMPQQLDNAVADAAASMNRDTGRLVDNQEFLILEYDPVENPVHSTLSRRVARRPNSRRRHPHLVALLQLVLGPYPATIHPDLATTQNPVQAPFRDSRELTAQEIVNTLACLLGINANFAHFGVDRGRSFWGLFLHDQ
jgi:hypothetical protein